jgi:hypothetical protein
MRRLLFLFMFLTAAVALQAQNAKVSGTVFDSETGKAVSGASVKIGSTEVKTNSDGYFEINNIATGKSSVTVTIDGYEAQTSTVDIAAPETKLGAFGMKTTTSANGELSGISTVDVSALDFEDENKGQNISGLLHSTSDVFVNTAGFTLGAAYFRIRGYDSDNSTVYMSGVQVNDPENGRPSWSEWGGLNDAMRNKEVVNGLGAARFSFGAVGGTTNIITRASMQRKQNKLSYSLSNKSYTNRIMYTYSTGLMKNNWAFTVSGSRRWGNESYVDGVFYDAWAYFASAEKKINEKHSIALTAYASPTKRGMQAGTTAEAAELTGTHYYNPNWGYQNNGADKRNAKVKNFNEPMFIFNHYWKVNPKMKVTNSLAYSFGRNGTSALNWYNAPDPRPDYYRYLPSYQTNANLAVTPDPAVVAALTSAWQNDVNTQQINWDHLYLVNTLANATGAQANYVVEEKRADHSQIMLNSLLNYQKNDNVMFSGGVELSKYTGHHFKTIIDMLGGDYWVDIDQFAVQDYHGNLDSMQNDMNNPNRHVKAGDIYGWNYNIFQNSGLLWGQAEFSYNKIEYFVALNVSHTTFWREGLMKNGRNPDNSLGNSEKCNYTNYGIKVGATYKINGHNFIVGNAGYMSDPPYASYSFVSPDIKNTLTPGIGSQKTLSGDISYIYKSQRASVRLTAYQTMMSNGSRVISFYHDDYATFVNMTMTGIDKTLQGFELGADVKATSTINIIGVAAIGNYRYTSRPTATVSYENGSVADITETVYQKNFYVSGTPQNAYSIGVKYAHPKYWYFNANLNYFDKMYLDFNPERRTEEAISGLGIGDTMISKITKQEKLDGGFTFDASLGKSLIYKKAFININFSVSNIFNNQDLITGGYEQMRFDYATKNINKFTPKYFYGLGRTFYLTVSVRI